jgi:hypothetical protein
MCYEMKKALTTASMRALFVPGWKKFIRQIEYTMHKNMRVNAFASQ